ncbi:MAG: DUF1467 family protein [Pseudomonadota bacterium]
MSIVFAVAIYFVLWWTVLFAILPLGVRSQDEDGSVVPGTEPGAPIAPRLLFKALLTTLVSAALFGAVYALDAFGIISIQSFLFGR